MSADPQLNPVGTAEDVTAEPGTNRPSGVAPSSPMIRNAADLEVWRERLSSDRSGVAAILDEHGRPRLMTEGENGRMYVSSTGGEEDGAPWDPAEMELFFYGPFTVIHPPTSLPPWPMTAIEQEYLSNLSAIVKLDELRKAGAITEDDAEILRAGLDAGPSLLIDNVKLRSALAARDPETLDPRIETADPRIDRLAAMFPLSEYTSELAKTYAFKLLAVAADVDRLHGFVRVNLDQQHG